MPLTTARFVGNRDDVVRILNDYHNLTDENHPPENYEIPMNGSFLGQKFGRVNALARAGRIEGIPKGTDLKPFARGLFETAVAKKKMIKPRTQAPKRVQPPKPKETKPVAMLDFNHGTNGVGDIPKLPQPVKEKPLVETFAEHPAPIWIKRPLGVFYFDPAVLPPTDPASQRISAANIFEFFHSHVQEHGTDMPARPLTIKGYSFADIEEAFQESRVIGWEKFVFTERLGIDPQLSAPYRPTSTRDFLIKSGVLAMGADNTLKVGPIFSQGQNWNSQSFDPNQKDISTSVKLGDGKSLMDIENIQLAKEEKKRKPPKKKKGRLTLRFPPPTTLEL